MNSIYGMEVVISPIVADKPKLQFDSSFLGESTPVINEFNHWLKCRFGTNPSFIITRNRIYCSALGFATLKRLTAGFCTIPIDGSAS